MRKNKMKKKILRDSALSFLETKTQMTHKINKKLAGTLNSIKLEFKNYKLKMSQMHNSKNRKY